MSDSTNNNPSAAETRKEQSIQTMVPKTTLDDTWHKVVHSQKPVNFESNPIESTTNPKISHLSGIQTNANEIYDDIVFEPKCRSNVPLKKEDRNKIIPSIDATRHAQFLQNVDLFLPGFIEFVFEKRGCSSTNVLDEDKTNDFDYCPFKYSKNGTQIQKPYVVVKLTGLPTNELAEVACRYYVDKNEMDEEDKVLNEQRFFVKITQDSKREEV
uniref:ZP domain-containing protein n=1 Tax=Rhabditophanes sp. KR3021 TaxID=114890 RepID=A0AC35UHI5_9BILA